MLYNFPVELMSEHYVRQEDYYFDFFCHYNTYNIYIYIIFNIYNVYIYITYIYVYIYIIRNYTCTLHTCKMAANTIKYTGKGAK